MSQRASQWTKNNLGGAVTVQMARCSDRSRNHVAFTALDGRMSSTLGNVCGVSANAARCGLNVAPQIARRRGARWRSMATGAFRRKIDFDAPIDV